MNEVDIFNLIKQNIDPRYLTIVDLELRETNNKSEKNAYFIYVKAEPTPWRLDSSTKTLTKIKFGRKVNYISFPVSYAKILSDYSISYSKIKSEDALRVSIDEFSTVSPEIIKHLFTNLMLDAFNFQSFGCCGKFKECEKEKICLHDDILYSTACQWRKIISKEKQKWKHPN